MNFIHRPRRCLLYTSIIGNYRWWEKPFYAVGLTCYDLLAGRKALGRSLPMLKRSVLKEIPSLKHEDVYKRQRNFSSLRVKTCMRIPGRESSGTEDYHLPYW